MDMEHTIFYCQECVFTGLLACSGPPIVEQIRFMGICLLTRCLAMGVHITVLFKVLTKKFVKDGTSRFQNFSVNFHKCSCSVLYEIITIRLGCHKICSRWVPKMHTGVHKMQRMAFGFYFFRAISQR
jgi:hypothetical protein